MSRLAGGRWLTTRSPIGDRAAGDALEAGDHAQQRGLAAARRADQHDELAVGDVDADAVQDLARRRTPCDTLRIATCAIVLPCTRPIFGGEASQRAAAKSTVEITGRTRSPFALTPIELAHIVSGASIGIECSEPAKLERQVTAESSFTSPSMAKRNRRVGFRIVDALNCTEPSSWEEYRHEGRSLRTAMFARARPAATC